MPERNIANRLASLFYTAENGNLVIRDDEPDTDAVTAMVRDANLSYGLGWDWSYTAVRECLYWIAGQDEQTADAIEENAHEAADSLTDVYTAELVRWLADAPLAHLAICDEAAEEIGGSDDTLEQRLRLGQYEAYRRAMQAIADNWPDEEEADDEG